MAIREIVRDLTPEAVRMLKRRAFRVRDGEIALRARFQQVHGRPYDPSNIRTFTDKLYRRMIELNRHADQRFTRFADKFSVRNFVRETIGEEHLTALIWSGTNPSHIPFDTLPSECIIKTNNGCGGHIVHDPDADHGTVISRLSQSLRDNYFWSMREYQYYDVKPRVLIEELLDDGQGDGPLDYRFWCFHGKPEVVQVDNNSHSINPFYDLTWKKLPLHYRSNGVGEIQKPKNFDEMLLVASKLANGFDFVRIDLYNVHGRTLFGEMTFTPVAGGLKLQPAIWDHLLGEKWGASAK